MGTMTPSQEMTWVSERKVANAPTVRTKTKELDTRLGGKVLCMTSCSLRVRGDPWESRRAGQGLDGLQLSVSWQRKMCRDHRKRKWGTVFFRSSRGGRCYFRVGKAIRTFSILYVFVYICLCSLPVDWILVSGYGGHHSNLFESLTVCQALWRNNAV